MLDQNDNDRSVAGAEVIPASGREANKFQDTGELSFLDEAIDFSSIRAVSFAYLKGQDWREFDAHDLAIAAEWNRPRD
jgi:hypothetical protein